MSHDRQDQELLEYLYGCHEDPAALEARLAEDSELRTRLEALRGTKGLLDQAARSPLDLELPLTEETQDPAPARGFPFRKLAAAALVALLAVPWSLAGLAHQEVRTLERQVMSLFVSGPSGVPDGAPVPLRIETRDADDELLAATVTWTARDGEGAVLDQGEVESSGALDLSVVADLSGVRAVDVRAEQAGQVRETTVEVRPGRGAPLVHLASDKPLYRPGETVLLRSVMLDRLSLEPLEGWARLRIVDPKGVEVESHSLELEAGVGSLAWTIPEDRAGGEYALEVRDATDAYAFERLPLQVRRFQPPQLAKQVHLDRETYAPGESGLAEVVVRRVEGGLPTGASLRASVVVDGAVVWSERGTLDERGRASFAFVIPASVDRGDARFLASIADGGVLETAVEPFVVPTGGLRVDLYPEGGELVAATTNRVYAEVVDPLDRPASARGELLDASGAVVAAFETLHQGRARFEFVPRAGERYSVRLEGEDGVHPLPAVTEGVALRALADTTPAAEPLDLEVSTPSPGPWIAAAFCRGALVGQTSFRGEGQHELSLELPDSIAGVLRVTVFDRSLRPVAERLVHRESGRALTVSVRPDAARTLPGARAGVELLVTDESGAPVSAVLGVTVSDRGVRAASGVPRVGLADQTWLTGDVEELEEVEDFLATTDEARLNVDLLLGTRGWRRFGWIDGDALVEAQGDPARRLLLREGHGGTPQARTDAGVRPEGLVSAWRRARHTRERALGGSYLAAFLAGLWALGAGLVRLPWLRARPRQVLAVYCGGLAAAFGLLLPTLFNSAAPLPGAAIEQMVASADSAMDMDEAWFPAETSSEAPGRLLLDEDWQAREAMEAMGLFDARAFNNAIGIGGGAGGGPGKLEASADADLSSEALQALGYTSGEGETQPEQADDGSRGKMRQQPGVTSWGRVYAHERAPREPDAPRRDFTETVYWNGLLRTNQQGTARVAFDLSDRVTTWDVWVDAHGSRRVGQAQGFFEAVPALYLTAKLPVELSEGDRIDLPVAVVSEDPGVTRAGFAAAVQGPLSLGAAPGEVLLDEGRGRAVVPLTVTGSAERARVALVGQALGHTDRVVRELRVVPRGFPQRVSKGGRLDPTSEFEVAVPAEFVAGSLSARLVVYPAPLAGLYDGASGILQEPYGCFEQTSATHYPNVLALNYLRASGTDSPAEVARAEALIGRGYERLVGFECSRDGFEWFGSDPGHEVLSAYGLLEFADTAAAADIVDGEMVARTRAWLLGRRNGEGGYDLDPQSLDSFGRAAPEVTDAYCTYALVLSGCPLDELEVEVAQLEARALESEDPYEVALAASALQAAGRAEPAAAARGRLRTWQQEDGSLIGTNSTITRSGGDDLLVETTSLAMLAWMEGEEDSTAHVQRALDFVLSRRRAQGTFGATQATVQALRALTGYAVRNRRTAQAGELVVYVDDAVAQRFPFEAGREGAIELDLAPHLTPGAHRVRLAVTGDNRFPFAFDLAYFAETPASDPGCVVGLETELSSSVLREGEQVALLATVTNRTDEGQPMTLAVLGLPAGLEVSSDVLDALQEAGRFDLWELRGREVVLYWRDLAPGEVREVTLDLVGRIPGTTTGPASRAYLYYTPDARTWSDPLEVEVLAGR